MTEELVNGGQIATCTDCGKMFAFFHKGTPQKRCPQCTDKKQDRPSVVQQRKMLHKWEGVKIDSLPSTWDEKNSGKNHEDPHHKIDLKGRVFGASWNGRIVIFASDPFKEGDIVDIREMEVQHLIKVVRKERRTMHHGTVDIEEEKPLQEEGDEVIRTRKYLVLEKQRNVTQTNEKLVWAVANTKTTLKGFGRQYWAQVVRDACIASWMITGGYRSGRAHTDGVLAIVSSDHPLIIKKTGDIEGVECYT